MSRAQSLRLSNLRQLGRLLDRTYGHPGLGRYARVLASAPPATRSELEDRVHDLIVGAGFAPPLVNVPIRLEGRRVMGGRSGGMHVSPPVELTQLGQLPKQLINHERVATRVPLMRQRMPRLRNS